MLKKLLKHELKATSRWFLPLFGVALFMAIMARLTMPLNDFDGILRIIPVTIMIIYVISLVAVVMVSIILIVYRFYRNMVTDEGYLTHTLPVSITSQIVTKLLIAGLWIFLSIIVFISSILILLLQPGMLNTFMNEVRNMWQMAQEYFSHSQLNLIVFEIILLSILAIFSLPLMAYGSIAVGQIISKNKVAGSIVGFIIINIASNVVSTVGLIPYSLHLNSISHGADSMLLITNGINGIILVSALITLLFSVALFFLTTYIFKNKLNLE